jgi:hypothetical protein
MLARGPIHFVLTLKGNEELTMRTYRLDLKLRNILFLIQRGTPTFEGILQNSIFPREEVVEKLRGLIKEQFIALGGGAAPPPATIGTPTRPATIETPANAEALGPQTATRATSTAVTALEPGASASQARFVLCDFCLDQFGANAPAMIDAINGSIDIAGLQKVLDNLVAEVQKKHKDQLPALTARIREINETKI